MHARGFSTWSLHVIVIGWGSMQLVQHASKNATTQVLSEITETCLTSEAGGNHLESTAFMVMHNRTRQKNASLKTYVCMITYLCVRSSETEPVS
ncbi:hypothetical protein F5Y16DRAFT_371050 [Xylariaceae sp. FL0255]|nr:hypothetical protein F5Y16DRAFT_371050 [Xylariaceae sp. FL0255]